MFSILASSSVDTWYNKCVDAINNIYGGGIIDDIRPWLDVGPDGNYSNMWTSIETIYDGFVVIGVLLLILYFMITILANIERDQFTLDSMIKSTIEFLVAYIFISYGYDIILGLLAIGDDLLVTIEESLANSDKVLISDAQIAALDEYKTETVDSSLSILQGFLMMLYYFGNLMIPDLLNKAGMILVYVACLSRGIEVAVRTMFCPIAIADVFKAGMHSPGIRYMKKFAAVCFQGAVIYAILLASNLIRGSLADGGAAEINGLSSMACCIGITFVSVAMIFKSQQLANDIAGV